jgi:hypothetical protein
VGASTVNTTAFLADLRCNQKIKMKRQEENEQQHCRANKAPQIMRILHAGKKHGLEPKQCSFLCQWKMTTID